MKNKKMIIAFLVLVLVGIAITIVMISIMNNNENNMKTAKVDNDFNLNEKFDKEEKKIFGEYNISEGMNDKDPKIPQNLLNNNYTFVVKVKVIAIGSEAQILPRTENFYNPYMPYTPIEIEVIDSISGDNLTGKMTVYIQGGDIKISALEKTIDVEEQKKMGIYDLTKEEKESMFIEYSIDNNYDLVENNEYVLLLSKQATDLYTINSNGYGIFVEDSSIVKNRSNSMVLKNVLTGNKLEM